MPLSLNCPSTPVLGPSGDWRGEGNKRDGKGNGDAREDGALGSWGLPGGPWDSCGSPGVLQRPLGASRGPPGGPGGPLDRGLGQ